MSKQFEYNLRNKFFTDTKELAYVGKVDDPTDVIWSSNYVKYLESLVKNNVVLDIVSFCVCANTASLHHQRRHNTDCDECGGKILFKHCS